MFTFYEVITNIAQNRCNIENTGRLRVYIFKDPAPEQAVSIYVGGVYLFFLDRNRSALN